MQSFFIFLFDFNQKSKIFDGDVMHLLFVLFDFTIIFEPY